MSAADPFQSTPVDDLRLDPRERAELAERVAASLRQAAPGSEAALRGSLATGRADVYSDVDIMWRVPEALFAAGVADIREILSGAGKVESLRTDPEYARLRGGRLFFVRFAGVPLFWRVDLEIEEIPPPPGLDEQLGGADRAEIENERPHVERAESAMMNGVAAVRACLRGRPEEAGRLLRHAYERARVSAPAIETEDPGRLLDIVEDLAAEVARREPRIGSLAERVRALVERVRPLVRG